MALVHCRECGNEISTEAPSCSHCGVINPVVAEPAGPMKEKGQEKEQWKAALGWAIGGFGLLVVFLIWTAISSGRRSRTSASLRTTNSGYMACATQAELERLIKVSADRDQAALGRVARGSSCTPLRPGLSVYISESSGIGKVCVRTQGQTSCVWTLREAID